MVEIVLPIRCMRDEHVQQIEIQIVESNCRRASDALSSIACKQAAQTKVSIQTLRHA